MIDWKVIRPRTLTLFLLWILPTAVYVVLGIVALYKVGWLAYIAISLPFIWLLAWMIARFWKAPVLGETAYLQPMEAPAFWTPTDAAAIQVIEDYRRQAKDISRDDLLSADRYIEDAKAMAALLSTHYHAADGSNAFAPVSLVEIFTVIHLAVEDIEQWMIESLPGSNLATIGNLQRLPRFTKWIDYGQIAGFLGTVVAHPARVLTYPIWRKAGLVTIELQNELVRALYQRYLRQLGYYLIEMYSGRLRGGSKNYRDRFGVYANALHESGGDILSWTQLQPVDTTIAVMGQVKAGKSSLINSLLRHKTAATNILPETRQVQRFQYELEGSETRIVLLDTPGYNEADITKRQRYEVELAAEQADIILLVMAANAPARDADVQMIRELYHHYREQKHLKPPVIIAALTHVDLLRPIREWQPPYNWRNPIREKEKSIANAVAYARELFGNQIVDLTCVCTGGENQDDSSVADELVPLLLKHLPGGQSAAILRGFYAHLSRRRFDQLKSQFGGLLKSLGQSVFGR